MKAAWDAWRAPLSFLHLLQALTKQPGYLTQRIKTHETTFNQMDACTHTHIPNNYNGELMTRIEGIGQFIIIKLLKGLMKSESDQWDCQVFACSSFRAGWYLYVSDSLQNLAIGCQKWRVRNLRYASQLLEQTLQLTVCSTQTIFGQRIVFNNSTEKHMVHKAQIWAPQDLRQSSRGTNRWIVWPELLPLLPSFANCFLAPQISILSATYDSDHDDDDDGGDKTEP